MQLPVRRLSGVWSRTRNGRRGGLGAGRAVGVLLARPQATVTGLDIYSGYWGNRRQHGPGAGKTIASRPWTEVARVLKPRGELVLFIVNPDWLTWVFAPPISAPSTSGIPARWRSLPSDQAGLGRSSREEA